MDFEGHLRNGERVLFRRIRPEDKEKLVAGFDQLSEQSRYHRFFRQIDHLSDEQLKYLTEIDFENHFAWLGVLIDQPGEPGVGVGRWIRLPNEPEIAESAITVVDKFQGEGIGSTLLWLLARSSIEHGIKALRVWVQGENLPVLAMLSDFGIYPTHWEAGVSEVDIPLPADPSQLDRTPAKILLRAVASGEIEAEAEFEDPRRAGSRIRAPETSLRKGPPPNS